MKEEHTEVVEAEVGILPDGNVCLTWIGLNQEDWLRVKWDERLMTFVSQGEEGSLVQKNFVVVEEMKWDWFD